VKHWRKTDGTKRKHNKPARTPEAYRQVVRVPEMVGRRIHQTQAHGVTPRAAAGIQKLPINAIRQQPGIRLGKELLQGAA
jgi:hypothetical protein